MMSSAIFSRPERVGALRATHAKLGLGGSTGEVLEKTYLQEITYLTYVFANYTFEYLHTPQNKNG